MPDAAGNIKGIVVPKVPWHRAEHETAIAQQDALWFDASERYYFYCSCGACGKPQPLRKTAVEEADLHLETTKPPL